MCKEAKSMFEKALWIDDLRNPDDFLEDDRHVQWAKTYESGLSVIDNADGVKVIHLDNDLGDTENRQGKHLFNHIEYLLHEGHLKDLEEVRIHSDNSSAVASMMLAKLMMKEKYGVDVSQVIYKS